MAAVRTLTESSWKFVRKDDPLLSALTVEHDEKKAWVTRIIDKVHVHFNPNVILVFTPERSNVDALRKQLEDTPKSTLLIRRKAKGSKGTGGEGSESGALEISFTQVDVIEESVNLDLKKMMENPCTCQFGGTCICSELAPSKSCGSVKAKKFTASNSAQRPGLASSALLANIAAYPRPIEIGPPPTASPFPYAAGIAIPALPPMMGHQPILPMPQAGQIGSLGAPVVGASTAVMNQRVPALLPRGLSMQTNSSFAGAMKPNQQFTDTGGHDPELLSALFALQQGGSVNQGMPLQPISDNSLNSPMLETQSSSSCCGGRRNTQDIWASAPKSCCGGMSESKPVGGGCCGSVAPPPRNATRCGCQSNSATSGGCCGGRSMITVQKNSCCGTPIGKSASGCCGKAALAVVHQAVADAPVVVVDARVEAADAAVHLGALTSRETI
ncbi:hypothetical protein SpCBS45565_g06368 [Spizellomyces sp. 'palustris']|nr:hypothetical protein SpCBS45565_g06368 [Spizellomyces sp. 'palustris']